VNAWPLKEFLIVDLLREAIAELIDQVGLDRPVQAGDDLRLVI